MSLNIFQSSKTTVQIQSSNSLFKQMNLFNGFSLSLVLCEAKEDFDICQICIGRVYPDSVSVPIMESGASSYISDCGRGYVYADSLPVTLVLGNSICRLLPHSTMNGLPVLLVSGLDVEEFSLVLVGTVLWQTIIPYLEMK